MLQIVLTQPFQLHYAYLFLTDDEGFVTLWPISHGTVVEICACAHAQQIIKWNCSLPIQYTKGNYYLRLPLFGLPWVEKINTFLPVGFVCIENIDIHGCCQLVRLMWVEGTLEEV